MWIFNKRKKEPKNEIEFKNFIHHLSHIELREGFKLKSVKLELEREEKSQRFFFPPKPNVIEQKTIEINIINPVFNITAEKKKLFRFNNQSDSKVLLELPRTLTLKNEKELIKDKKRFTFNL